jgi:adenosylhomocysteine nucleosidase
MRILFVAADKMEYAGLLANATGVHTRRLKLHWAREARLSGHAVLLLANGAGAARAAAAVDAACGEFRPEAVVSTGFCGALDPALTVAAVVVATRICGADSDYPALPVSSGLPFCAGPVRSIGHVARTAEEKRSLRATGACAVEMEAAGVAARVQELGLAFYCIRGVTDLAGETLENDFNQALRPDGHFGTISILASALRYPAVRLPELVRLRRRCVLTSRALGIFLANCRF